MGGGSVVGGGAHLKLDSAGACCAACEQHNIARPRPRGRRNCTTWVYNADLQHPQAKECWFKSHANPWADINLLAGGSRSWTTGVVGEPPSQAIFGQAPTARSCGDDRWRRPRSANASSASEPLYFRRGTPGVHTDELSLCAPVSASEASLAIDLHDGGSIDGAVLASVRIRLNRAASPKATAWLDSVLAAGSCGANRTKRRCAPHCCNFYRPEAVVGVHRLPAEYLRAHGYDPARPPHWGRDYWWGPPYGFLQGRLWHSGPGPWSKDATDLPTEHSTRHSCVRSLAPPREPTRAVIRTLKPARAVAS